MVYVPRCFSGPMKITDRSFGNRAEASFPHLVLRDGEELTFGRCRRKCIETPGHSLDSISILVTDLDRSPEPFAVLTGDTLFIGDVGRPDLSKGKSAAEMASLLYSSLHRKLLRLPDGVEVITDTNHDFIPAGQDFVESDTGELVYDVGDAAGGVARLGRP